MAFTVDTSQLNRLAANLGKAGIRGTRKAQQAIRKTALDIESKAKQFAPVDTGALRSSIGSTITGGGMSAVIGPTVAYAPYQEWGTSRMEAHPFMGPAVNAAEPGFVAAMEQIAAGVLDE